MAYYEKVGRSLAKSISFRIIIVIADEIIFYLLTGSYKIATEIVIISNLSSTVIFYLHERVWNRIGWGKKIRKT